MSEELDIIWAVKYKDGLVEAWGRDQGPPSYPYVYKEHLDKLREEIGGENVY